VTRALRARPALRSVPQELERGGPAARSSTATRLLTISLLVAALISLLLAVPGLHTVAREISHVSGGWLALAAALELASCASFVVVFRHFFKGIAARGARELAWTEMGSGALLPGGGVGSLAVGGWLLHLAGMPTRKIVRRRLGRIWDGARHGPVAPPPHAGVCPRVMGRTAARRHRRG